MSNPPAIVRWISNEVPQTLKPSTLSSLGKDEAFLENVVAGEPSLLGLESRRSGVRGPFYVVRQCALPSPTGKTIYPDIVLLAASGHIIVVEVKLRSNPELVNRSVLAQTIDYAASLVSLTGQQLHDVLFPGDKATTWSESIAAVFSGEADTDDLAEQLLDRVKSGEINLVIACDSAPSGLREVIAGIASQSTLGFDFDLVEITPYVVGPERSGEIIFVPARRLATEIVARTSVTVSYREGDQRPSTDVKTMTMEEIEQNIRSVSASQLKPTRIWSAADVDDVFGQLNDPVRLSLLSFARQYSYNGQWITSRPTQSATFRFTIPVKVQNRIVPRMAFYCVSAWGFVILSLGSLQSSIPPDTYRELVTRLKKVFGDSVDTNGKEPSVGLDVMRDHLAEFQQLMQWLKGEMEAVAEA